jgi:SAM-dependent methyltransferase
VTSESSYTLRDHLFRSADPYANGKYVVTTRWIDAAADDSRTLYHVGCGSGAYNSTAVDLGFRVEAFEPDAEVAAIAAKDPPPGCTVHMLSLEQIEGESVADVIVMHDVLEHIENDADAVARLRGLIKPDGQLVLSVPAVPRLYGLHDEQLGHYRRYTKSSLRKVLEPHFDIRRIRYYGFAFLPVSLVQSRWLRRPYPTDAAAKGLLSTILRFATTCEARIPTPIGTSLLVHALPRASYFDGPRDSSAIIDRIDDSNAANVES